MTQALETSSPDGDCTLEEHKTPVSFVSPKMGQKIAVAAILIMLGNLTSRIFGQVREMVIASHFGVSGKISLFTALSAVPTQIYDFLVGGLVSAALVPVFSDYIKSDDQDDLWRLVSTVATVVLLALITIGGLVWIFSSPIARTLATDLVATAEDLATATAMLRIMIGAVIFMGLSGLLTGLLQAQQRFLLPAFTTSVFNIAMILVLALVPYTHIQVLAFGMLAGAFGQMILQLPGLSGAKLRPLLNLHHPGVRRIGRLYAPVALGISFSLIGTLVDRRLVTSVPNKHEAATYMRYATTLIQCTLGLISAAISLAILPTLARLNSANNQIAFRRVLGMGLQVVFLLIVPAVVVLATLGQPIIKLLYERGVFTTENTRITTLVLLAYLPSLLAAAIDQPLIFAFYARKHTLLPNLVQGGAVASYFVVALTSYRQWGMYGLIAANVMQWVVHALLMIWLAQRCFKLFIDQHFVSIIGKIAFAASLMALVCWGCLQLLPETTTHFAALLAVIIAGGMGILTYGVILWWMKLTTLRFFLVAMRRRGSDQPAPTLPEE